jgi:hypothetical protein
MKKNITPLSSIFQQVKKCMHSVAIQAIKNNYDSQFNATAQ